MFYRLRYCNFTFTFLIVKIKHNAPATDMMPVDEFTFLIVKIKLFDIDDMYASGSVFTFLIVKIKRLHTQMVLLL
ncbi:MAG: hypothetical protein ACRCWG_05215 [Sarcina sp.]